VRRIDRRHDQWNKWVFAVILRVREDRNLSLDEFYFCGLLMRVHAITVDGEGA
jgi:hypothetical protein